MLLMLYGVVGCGSVGIKQRLAAAEAKEGDAKAPPPKTGGIRQRQAGSSIDPKAPLPKRGGIKRRLGGPELDPPAAKASSSSSSMPASDKPFEQDLKADWAKGRISSQQVQKYVMGSMKQ